LKQSLFAHICRPTGAQEADTAGGVAARSVAFVCASPALISKYVLSGPVVSTLWALVKALAQTRRNHPIVQMHKAAIPVRFHTSGCVQTRAAFLCDMITAHQHDDFCDSSSRSKSAKRLRTQDAAAAISKADQSSSTSTRSAEKKKTPPCVTYKGVSWLVMVVQYRNRLYSRLISRLVATVCRDPRASFDVEAVVGKRVVKGRILYFIKWQGSSTKTCFIVRELTFFCRVSLRTEYLGTGREHLGSNAYRAI